MTDASEHLVQLVWLVCQFGSRITKTVIDLNDSEVFNFQIWNPDLKIFAKTGHFALALQNKPTIDWCTCPSPMENNGWMEGSSQIRII